ncbi:MAG: hypothetical protein JNL67_11555 [Planctomycetaceae bacterium]|nr:hypothetical protein [Planctomycetaceae bacterium]
MKPKFNPRTILFGTLILVGGWFLFHRNEIRNLSDAWQVANRQIHSLSGGTASLLQTSEIAPTGQSSQKPNVLRIASFNLHNYGLVKSKRFHVLDAYAKIFQNFDVVAVQGIRTDDSNVIATLLDHINKGGRAYGILTSPRLGRQVPPLQYAFIFDTRRVQPIDKPYVVSDPEGLLQRPPFVGWFRAVGPSPEQAFTFSMVNWLVDSAAAETEVPHLVNLCRAVRQDGRQEDDVLLAGTIQFDSNELTPLVAGSDFQCLIRAVPTVVDGDWQVDNFVCDSKATIEYTGRSGSFDFLREYNLNVAQSLEISEHLPIWAEFFLEEGRSSGLVASDPSPITRPAGAEIR